MRSADKPRETNKARKTPTRSAASPKKSATPSAGTKAAPRRAAAPRTKNSSYATAASPTEEEIRFRAYQIFLRRGCAHGHDHEDWLQAERELRALQTSGR
jgi:hypothetical protein